jgi:HK97 family phage prohead protease
MKETEKRIVSLDNKTHARAVKDGEGKRFIEGYASVFNQRSKLIWDYDGIYYEEIQPGAFDRALQDPELDVLMVFNHDNNKILARSSKKEGKDVASTLELSVDDTGLKYRFEVPNTTLGNDTFELVNRGDLFESSFRFAVAEGGQHWDTLKDGSYLRTINDIEYLADTSIVYSGAYSNTDIATAKRHLNSYNMSKDEKTALEAKEAEERKAAEELKLKEEADAKVKAEAELRAKIEKELDEKAEAEKLEAEMRAKIEKERSSQKQKNEVEELKTMKKRFDLGKAVSQSCRGTLDGVEAEIHQEGLKSYGTARENTEGMNSLVLPSWMINGETQERAAISTTTGASDIETLVHGLDITPVPSQYANLGATVFENLSSNYVLNFSKGESTAFVAEGGANAESTPTKATNTLAPRRISGWKLFNKEYMAQSKIVGQEIADLLASVDRTISADLLSAAVLANIHADYEAADVSKTIAFADVLKLAAALELDNFASTKWAISKPLAHDMEAIEKASGSGRFLIENNTLIGYPSIGTSLLPIHTVDQYDIILGDWSRSYVGWFGGAEIIVDPFSASSTGQVKMTVNRLGDTSVNPYAFSSGRNFNLV